MRGRNRYIALVAFAAISLSGCVFGDDGSSQYSNPTLFMSHVDENQYVWVRSSKIQTGSIKDYDLLIRDAILDAGPFESVSSVAPTTDRYIVYHLLLANSTIGPHYSDLLLYDDGSMQINYQKGLLGSLKTFSFKMDADKASKVNDKTEARINEVFEAARTAKEQVKDKVNIEQFIFEVGQRKTVPTTVFDTETNYSFCDDGTILNEIKKADFQSRDEFEAQKTSLVYNADWLVGPGDEWTLTFSYPAIKAKLSYRYKDRFQETYSYSVYYKLSSADGNAIYSKALEAAKAATPA